MLVVAGFGLVVNLISMRLLSAGKESSLNVKGAYLEVWSDMSALSASSSARGSSGSPDGPRSTRGSLPGNRQDPKRLEA